MAFSTSWSQYNYHVFLSLRGKDTGKGFGDHLYTALEQAGFHTFRDDDEIVRREELDIELQKAMQESKLFLVVFSKDFASSTWCLDQLVKIMDLRPVFYVDPMLVSDQADSYAAAFASHEENSKEKAEIWRAALREVSDLGGMVLQDGYQAEFVQDIVKELFSQHVFGKANPNDGFMEHSLRAVKYCCGIPLALREWGTFLSDIDISEWNNALDKLEAILHNGIFKVLRVSYDSLKDDLARRLFLHIACFFIGMESDYVTKILDGCELFAKAGIQDLVDRFLLTIGENNRLIMHPLLRDMAREIVRQESPDDPGRRSRLWSHDDSISVLRENTVCVYFCASLAPFSFFISHLSLMFYELVGEVLKYLT
ncbi:unnamed protein product [Linum tenue]|uniref:TIR domain-containing protein n=1 Tax=Linum tenue TaxID=586396 RepID=A0AAV0LDL0_9ROSI|nr:unnamed protein product [Linum tenue]